MRENRWKGLLPSGFSFDKSELDSANSVQCPERLIASARTLVTEAAVEAAAANTVNPGGAGGSGENQVVLPSTTLANRIADFTRRAENNSRSAGAKRRRAEDGRTSEASGSGTNAPVAPQNGVAQALVPAWVPALDGFRQELFQRMDRLQTTVDRLSASNARLATEVALLKGKDDDDNADAGNDDDNGN